MVKKICYRVVRKRAWGLFAAEIWDTWKKTHDLLVANDTAEQTTHAYDAVAIKFEIYRVYSIIFNPNFLQTLWWLSLDLFVKSLD